MIYQSRTFKGSALPSTVSASGLVPAELTLGFSHVSPMGRLPYRSKLRGRSRRAGIVGSNLQNGKINVPLPRMVSLRKSLRRMEGRRRTLHHELEQFTCSGTSTTLTAQSQMLIGALVDAVQETKSLQWRAELGIVGLGGTGADAPLTARKWLFERQAFSGNSVRAEIHFDRNLLWRNPWVW